MKAASDELPLGAWLSTTPVLRYAYRARVPRHGRQGDFAPAWYSCWMPVTGAATCRFPGHPDACARAGEWLLLPPDRMRYQSISRDTVLMSIAFTLPWPDGQPAPLARPLHQPRSPALETAAERLLASLPGRGLPGELPNLSAHTWLATQAALAAFVALWFDTVASRQPVSATPGLDQRLLAARRALAARPRMGAVDYDHLQRVTGLGRAQLDRLFRRDLGHSPREERDRHLMQAVLDALADPHLSVAGIAARLGFTDNSHLCRWFKARIGVTPERYRRGDSWGW